VKLNNWIIECEIEFLSRKSDDVKIIINKYEQKI